MEEKRSIERKQVYLGQGFNLKITLKKNGDTFPAEAQDLSPTGIGAVFTNSEPQTLDIGDPVSVAYTSPLANGLKVHGVVASIYRVDIQGKNYLRVGVCFLGSEKAVTDKGTFNRRLSPRYSCPEFLRPMAMAKTPLFFGDDIHLQVINFGVNSMGCFTSLRNKFIQKGMELDFKITFPIMGDHMVKGRIASVTLEMENKRIRLGVEYIDPTESFATSMSEFILLVDKSLSPKLLKESGFVVKTVDKAITLDYARTAEDYKKILELRLEANRAAGKFQALQVDDMASRYDVWSRQVVARYGDDIVGAVRVTFTNGQPERSSFLSTDGYKVPPEFLESHHMETGNMVIKPTFQKTNLFCEVARFAVKTCMESGGRFLLAAAEDAVLPLYYGIGFEKVDEKMVEPKPGWRFKGTLVVLNLQSFASENHPHTRSYSKFGPVWKFVQDAKGHSQNQDGPNNGNSQN